MFHVADGLFFERTDDGSVRIIKRESGKEDSPIIFEQTIHADGWASVVSSVSKGGEIDNRYLAAEALHNSEGEVEIRYPGCISPKQAVALLNEALKADPKAVNQLFRYRVPCNEVLAEHKTVQVRAYPVEGDPVVPNLGVLGLINGIFGRTSTGYGYLQAEIDTDTNHIVAFSLYLGVPVPIRDA